MFSSRVGVVHQPSDLSALWASFLSYYFDASVTSSLYYIMKNVTDLTREEEDEETSLVDAGKKSPPLPPPVDNEGVFLLRS